jgi:hypothetical protein
MIHRLENGRFRLVAANNVEAEYCKWLAQNPPPTDRNSISGRAIAECTTIHDPEYKLKRAESLRRGGQRSTLGVPLLREGVPIGAIALHRTAPKCGHLPTSRLSWRARIGRFFKSTDQPAACEDSAGLRANGRFAGWRMGEASPMSPSSPIQRRKL